MVFFFIFFYFLHAAPLWSMCLHCVLALMLFSGRCGNSIVETVTANHYRNASRHSLAGHSFLLCPIHLDTTCVVAVAHWLLTIVVAWVCKILLRMNVDADFVRHFPFNATFSIPKVPLDLAFKQKFVANFCITRTVHVNEVDMEVNNRIAQIPHVSASP